MDLQSPDRLIEHCEIVCIKVRPSQADHGEPTPTVVNELKLFGIWNPRGIYLGHRFLSSSGQNYNILSSCDVFRDAMVYKGPRTGIQAAADQVGLSKDFREINTWVFPVCDSAQVQAPFASNHRRAELQLRLVEGTSHRDNEVYRDLAASPDEVAAIMILKSRSGMDGTRPGFKETWFRFIP